MNNLKLAAIRSVGGIFHFVAFSSVRRSWLLMCDFATILNLLPPFVGSWKTHVSKPKVDKFLYMRFRNDLNVFISLKCIFFVSEWQILLLILDNILTTQSLRDVPFVIENYFVKNKYRHTNDINLFHIHDFPRVTSESWFSDIEKKIVCMSNANYTISNTKAELRSDQRGRTMMTINDKTMTLHIICWRKMDFFISSINLLSFSCNPIIINHITCHCEMNRFTIW